MTTVVVRKWSTSDVVRSADGGATVFTKTYREGSGPGMRRDIICARTAREMDLLQRMGASGLFCGRLGAVRLAGGDPEAGKLVTAEAPGVELERVLWRSHGERVSRDCQQSMLLAGRWLRAYQSLPARPGDEARFGEGEPTDLAEYCDIRLGRLWELGYDWPDEAFRQWMREHLNRLVARASEEDRRSVWCHGDYGPQNILWDGRTLTPLDFAMARLDYPLLDVTYLIRRLEMLQVYFPWRRWPLDLWRRAILRGYGRPDADRTPMYEAMMIRHLHCRLVTYVRRKPLSLKERVHNAYVRGCVRRELERRVGLSKSSHA